MNRLLKIYALFLFLVWGMISKHILDYFNIYPFNNHFVQSHLHFHQHIQEKGPIQYTSVIPLHSKSLHNVYSDVIPSSYFQDRHQSSVTLECHVPYSKSMASMYIKSALVQNGQKIQTHYNSMVHVPSFSFTNVLKTDILTGVHLHNFDEIEIVITTHDNNFVYNQCHVYMNHMRYMFDSNALYFMVVIFIIFTGVLIHAGRKVKSKYDEVRIRYRS